MSNYVCPYCAAEDSTMCLVLPPAVGREYTEGELRRARAVGCRVAHYVDERARSSS